jgi:metal-responsive CopG/Arc/MetJ family transcriptional regulator
MRQCLLRFDDPLLDRIDAYRRSRKDIPSRTQAIRDLFDAMLNHLEKQHPGVGKPSPVRWPG